MISRRSFLKLAGLATVTVGAGSVVGAIAGEHSSVLRVSAFIPKNEMMLGSVLQLFTSLRPEIRDGVVLQYSGDRAFGKVAAQYLPQHGKSGVLALNVHEIGKEVIGDIILSDESRSLYDPKGDFSGQLSSIRKSLKNTNAGVLVTATFMPAHWSDLFKSSKLVAVVESNNRIQDKISLNRANTEIKVDGTGGKTVVEIGHGTARFKGSNCRHGLCVHQGSVGHNGGLVVCAPNKVLVRIEQA